MTNIYDFKELYVIIVKNSTGDVKLHKEFIYDLEGANLALSFIAQYVDIPLEIMNLTDYISKLTDQVYKNGVRANDNQHYRYV